MDDVILKRLFELLEQELERPLNIDERSRINSAFSRKNGSTKEKLVEGASVIFRSVRGKELVESGLNKTASTDNTIRLLNDLEKLARKASGK